MEIIKPGKKASIFFEIARRVEEENISELVGIRLRNNFEINNGIYSGVLGNRSNVKYMEALGVTVISTPEAEVISGAGGFAGKNGEFILPRFHLGVRAQMDMEVAMYQLANSPEMKKLIDECTPENSGIIYFAREGHLTNWQKAVFLTGDEKNLPTTIVSMSHAPANNIYTRESILAVKPNLEGFNLNNLRILWICDPVASGMQHVKMIEELVINGCRPEKIVTIAPMATGFGMRVINLACEEMGIESAGGCCSALLDSTRPLRYYSPYPVVSENQVVDVDLLDFVRKYFGDKLKSSCIRCNWTGTFMGGPNFPIEQSERELNLVGTSNSELLDICDGVKERDPRLVPYSTKLKLRGDHRIQI